MQIKTTTLLAALVLFAATAIAAEAERAETVAEPASAPGASGDKDGPDAATVARDMAEARAALAAAPALDRDVCLIPGRPLPLANYTVLKKVKAARGTYGSVTLVLPELVAKARAVGGDAVIDYNGSQRFGFFPWRLVRPVATGTAIHWTGDKPLDCTALGGSTLSVVINTNKPPGH